MGTIDACLEAWVKQKLPYHLTDLIPTHIKQGLGIDEGDLAIITQALLLHHVQILKYRFCDLFRTIQFDVRLFTKNDYLSWLQSQFPNTEIVIQLAQQSHSQVTLSQFHLGQSLGYCTPKLNIHIKASSEPLAINTFNTKMKALKGLTGVSLTCYYFYQTDGEVVSEVLLLPVASQMIGRFVFDSDPYLVYGCE